MFKITHAQYLEMLTDPETPKEMIMAFSTFAPDQGGAFDPVMVPIPRWVDMSAEQIEAESAMRIGNGLARWRREVAFRKALQAGDQRPVLVAEGDSWFQFPVFIDETITQLGRNYLVSCVSSAGDTAQNMIFGPVGPRGREYLQALYANAARVQAFLLSAAGNDIIGEDTETDDRAAVLRKILKHPGNDSDRPGDYINADEFNKRLNFLHEAYRTVCHNIRHDERFRTLPILLHGYDVPFPYPWDGSDRRNPQWAAKDRWLGSAFTFAGIKKPPIRREILKLMIDRLYDMLDRVADEYSHVHVVDCRGALPRVEDWADEIHATSQGYVKIAERFQATLRGLNIG